MTDRAKILDLQADLASFPIAWQASRRSEYLKGKLEDIVVDLLLAMERHRAAIAKGNPVSMMLEKDRIDDLARKALSIQAELIRWKERLRGKLEQITPDMIERARSYPFNQLHEFRRNAALCPFHEDHDPSFMLMKDNTARCFGACHASWDTIAFIREREGLSFSEAVRRLQ